MTKTKTLYKNVDIADLQAIMREGILPISKTGNDNWVDGRRAPNAKDQVYLFAPVGDVNSFFSYGFVLLEVETAATFNEIAETDFYHNAYEEYVVDEVKPENIKAIYIPELLRDRVANQVEGLKVTYVEIHADHYNGGTLETAPHEVLKMVADTMPLSTSDFNYGRGVSANCVKDLYNHKYQI